MLNNPSLTLAELLAWMSNVPSDKHQDSRAQLSSNQPGGENGGYGYSPRPEKLNLDAIPYTDVEDAYNFISPQLCVAWEHDKIKKNNFCLLRLINSSDVDIPPAIFGRISACFPREGEIKYISQIELTYPRFGNIPAVVVVKDRDLLPEDFGEPPQSFLFRVQILGNAEDGKDIEGYENQFFNNGFMPEHSYDSDSVFTLHLQDEEQKRSFPWICVIGSRWLSMLPNEIYGTVIANLRSVLMQKNRILINYHPERHPGSLILNKILKLRPGISPYCFYDADTFDEVIEIINQTFGTLFMRPLEELILQ